MELGIRGFASGSQSERDLALLWQIGCAEGFPFGSIGDSWVVGLLKGRPWDLSMATEVSAFVAFQNSLGGRVRTGSVISRRDDLSLPFLAVCHAGARAAAG